MYNKLIFLDIDGVLNNELWSKRRFEYDFSDNKYRRHFDPICVDNLNRITDNIGAEIVVSSTHRLTFKDVNEMKEELKNVGITGNVVDRTPFLQYNRNKNNITSSVPRGCEIKEWLDMNSHLLPTEYWNFRHYVILDDDSDMLYNQRFNFYHIDGYAGLSHRHAYKIINFFKSLDNTM
jgi:hypothetical protein